MTNNSLLQQQTGEQSQLQAAYVRVSPEELAEAVAAIEVRREVGGGQSIALGDAVRDLSLEATPEEILTEIEHRRTIAARRTKPKPKLWRRLAIAVAGMSLALNILLVIQNTSFKSQLHAKASPGSYSYRISIIDALTGRTPFYASIDDLRRIAKASTDRLRSSGSTYATEWSTDAPWQVVPLEDGLYVRGWHENMGAFNVRGTVITNSRGLLLSQPADARATTKTVPIDSFKDVRDPKFLVYDPVVDGMTYQDRHGEAVELPAN